MLEHPTEVPPFVRALLRPNEVAYFDPFAVTGATFRGGVWFGVVDGDYTEPENVRPVARADGWPICPVCEEDELYSLANPPSHDAITGCYNCNFEPGKVRR